MGNQPTSTELGIQTNVMAIREVIMEYFKGTCIDKLITGHRVSTMRLDHGILQYQYQRIQNEQERTYGVFLGEVHILTMKHAPDRLIFEATLDRSPQLRQIKGEIEQFMEKFLVGVEREDPNAK